MKILIRNAFKPIATHISPWHSFKAVNDNLTPNMMLSEVKHLCQEVCRGLIAAGFNQPTGEKR